MPKTSFLKVVLLALTLMPLVSLADTDEAAFEIYQNIIVDLETKYQTINQLTANVKQKIATLEEEANNIKNLITKYEGMLENIRQEQLKKHEKRLEILTQAHLKRLKEEVHVVGQARHAIQKDAKATRVILEELDTSVKKIAKLTNAISVSEDGKMVNVNGSYTLVIIDRSCANQRWYAEIDTQHQGSLLLDIRANFSHCTTGCHWAFRHLEVLFNAYASQVILSDTNNNGNGAGEWILTRIVTSGKHSEKMRLEKLAGTQKWCGPIDIKIESNQPLKLLRTGEL